MFAPQVIGSTPVHSPYPLAPSAAHAGSALHGGPARPMPGGSYPQPAHYPPRPRPRSPRSATRLIWVLIALLAIGAGVGTVVALVFR